MHTIPRLALVALSGLLAACGGPPAPLDTVVRVDDVVTGWFDAGVTDDGKNKIVPSISLKLTNTDGDSTGGIQLNCIFRRVGDPEEWSTALVRVADSTGIAPGATSKPVVVRAPQGYTGKHGSATWVKLGDFKIDRQLLTR